MKPPKILIIDDEQVVCKGCQLALEDEKYHVQICLTGKEGLNLIEEKDFDLILLDMKLPDIDGMEILKIVRQKRPELQVIVMTGYSTVQNAVEAMKLGAFDYLTKPFTDEEMIFSAKRAIEKKRLVEENLYLRSELFQRFRFENIVGDSPKMLAVFEKVERVAPMDSTVLLCGESGTGKELFAGAIHARSQRAHRQFIAVDCSTLSPSLLESELFGHVKGSFTGAIRDKEGIFSVANGGTLFMDDVTNLNLEIQGKLLRVLETGEYKPVGASRLQKTDVRIIAATNKDLKTMVEEGQFREDLFYRLNVFPIYIPPLRERKEDIPKLAYYFLRHFCRKTGKRIEGFSDEALESLRDYEWPGNVRQLKNVVERLVIMADQPKVDLVHLLDQLQMRQRWLNHSVPETLKELKMAKKKLLEKTIGNLEKAFLIKALQASQGNITRASQRVGMHRPNFCALLRKYSLSAEKFKREKEINEA